MLALLLALEVCEFVTPYPNEVWNWRRGSESNRRIRLLQSPALPLGYPATRLRCEIKSLSKARKSLIGECWGGNKMRLSLPPFSGQVGRAKKPLFFRGKTCGRAVCWRERASGGNGLPRPRSRCRRSPPRNGLAPPSPTGASGTIHPHAAQRVSPQPTTAKTGVSFCSHNESF